MSCQFFALLRDKTDGKFLWDAKSNKAISDQASLLTFAVGLENVCPDELLGQRNAFRDAKYPREYTTSETIDGINSDGAWGSVSFDGQVYFREDVQIEFSRRDQVGSDGLPAFDRFLEWFNEGGCAREFVWPRLATGEPVMAKFENGSLKNIDVVNTGTGRDHRVRFTLLLRPVNDEIDLVDCPPGSP